MEAACTDWRVAGKPDGTPPEVGKVYVVRHERKGVFIARIKAIDDEWATVEIVEGETQEILEYNRTGPGDENYCRALFCFFLERS